jgi:hypothetical protein
MKREDHQHGILGLGGTASRAGLWVSLDLNVDGTSSRFPLLVQIEAASTTCISVLSLLVDWACLP